METAVTQERQQAHALLDMLPLEKLTAVVHLLQAISNPVARSLANAPIDDEPIGEEEIRAVEASKEWFKDHAPIPHEEVLAVEDKWSTIRLRPYHRRADEPRSERVQVQHPVCGTSLSSQSQWILADGWYGHN
jgi:hypothetical protein